MREDTQKSCSRILEVKVRCWVWAAVVRDFPARALLGFYFTAEAEKLQYCRKVSQNTKDSFLFISAKQDCILADKDRAECILL